MDPLDVIAAAGKTLCVSSRPGPSPFPQSPRGLPVKPKIHSFFRVFMRLRVRVRFVFSFFLVILFNRSTPGICLHCLLARSLVQEGFIQVGGRSQQISPSAENFCRILQHPERRRDFSCVVCCEVLEQCAVYFDLYRCRCVVLRFSTCQSFGFSQIRVVSFS